MIADFDGTNLRVVRLAGSPHEIGLAHGQQLGADIRAGIEVYTEYFQVTTEQLLACPVQATWRDEEVQRHVDALGPWIIEEVEAMAAAAGIDARLLFDLSFNGMGEFAKRQRAAAEKPESECSIFALQDRDGLWVMLSVLDDSPLGWPAMGLYQPSDPDRRAFAATVWLGSAGAGRGMNESGLWMGTASCGVGIDPDGPLKDFNPLSLGLLMRAILERCGTVDDVLDFCNEYHFGCNMIVGDAAGRVRAIHQTPAGPFEIPTEPGHAAMTNAITDDDLINQMTRAGLICRESVLTSRPRCGFLQTFIREHQQNSSLEDIARAFATRDSQSPWAINNDKSVYLTLACPQREPANLYVCRPGPDGVTTPFVRLNVV